MSWAFIICTVIWVCEASKVNNLTVLAVGPNHRDNVLRRLYCFFTEVIPKKRLFRVGTLRVRQQFHSDFLPQKLSETGISVENTCSGWSEFSPVFVFVFVFACDLVFVIVITEASVDSMCHELSEYVWLYGSVRHRK